MIDREVRAEPRTEQATGSTPERPRRAGSSDRLLQVVQQHFGPFEADGNTQQTIGDARLRPLGADLSTYLQLRASAAGRKLDEFITPDGVDELRSRLTVKGPGQDAPVSLLYPLNVNNWMVAALNTAAELGAPRIDRDVVRAA